MAQTVAVEMPSDAEVAACAWLSERELSVYSTEFQRTGFQGGLQWYRCCAADVQCIADLQIFSGRTIDVPSLFIAAAAATAGVFNGQATTRRCRPRRARAATWVASWSMAPGIWSAAGATRCRESPVARLSASRRLNESESSPPNQSTRPARRVDHRRCLRHQRPPRAASSREAGTSRSTFSTPANAMHAQALAATGQRARETASPAIEAATAKLTRN